MDINLNVFTLNCWGIPVIAKNRKERIEAIGDYLLRSPHNIVALQEIWSETDYLYLKEKLKSVLPYSHYFYSGVVGSGLCVFSKWVIQDVFFHQWPLNGYVHKIQHGDWFGGKGVGLCRIQFDHQLINMYCTHLHAEYHEDDMYLPHRVLQAYSTAEFVKLTSDSAHVCILAGDLNAAPGDLSYKLITQIPGLRDPFNLHCEYTNPSIRKPSGTSDNINNSYSDVKTAQKAPEGKRIDHILFKVGDSWEHVLIPITGGDRGFNRFQNENKSQILNFGNPLPDRVPNQSFSYSDHNAITLQLKLTPAQKKTHRRVHSKGENCYETVTEAIKVCEQGVLTIAKSKRMYLTAGAVLFMFLIGTVGFWPNNIIYDVTKLAITGLCFYSLIMGSLWNKIELNSLKAGLTALQNFYQSRTLEQ